jgi:hypothetical protein
MAAKISASCIGSPLFPLNISISVLDNKFCRRFSKLQDPVLSEGSGEMINVVHPITRDKFARSKLVVA